MLAQGDLKLLALALIAEQPRHGYELIKLIEDKTRGAYSPSPGVVYPTLTFLEEASYVSAEAEGAKKRYTISDEGRAYLEENREIADMVLARLAAIGEKLARMRRKWKSDDDEEEAAASVPKLVDAALDNLRDVAVKRLRPKARRATRRPASSRSWLAPLRTSAGARLKHLYQKGGAALPAPLAVRRAGLSLAVAPNCVEDCAAGDRQRNSTPGAADAWVSSAEPVHLLGGRPAADEQSQGTGAGYPVDAGLAIFQRRALLPDDYG